MIHKTPNPSMRSKISEQSELAKFCFDAPLCLAGIEWEWLVAQLNRCVENWSRQYEGSEAYNEGSAWIFPNLAFVTAACWLHNIFNHKSSTVGKYLKSSTVGKHLLQICTRKLIGIKYKYKSKNREV